MIFLLPLIGVAISSLGAGAAAVTATAATSTGLGMALGGLGAAAGLGAGARGAAGAAARKTMLDVASRKVLGGVAGNLGESFVKNVFCDAVRPTRGSILKVDLVGGGASHTGVYLGNNHIAEVTEIDGDAVVRIVSPSEFQNGEGQVRTGAFVYVAAAREDDEYRALGRESIARRAEAAIGNHGRYNLAFNNCHMFTRYCITGESQGFPIWSASSIASSLRDEFGVDHVSWRSTGDFA